MLKLNKYQTEHIYNRAHSTGLPSDWSKYHNLKKLSQQENEMLQSS